MASAAPQTDLPTRRLGRSEIEAAIVGLGCNNFGRRVDLEATAAVIEAALDSGVTFFDTADVYGEGGASERMMGEVLEGHREDFLIATKFGLELRGIEGAPDAPRGSRDYIRWAIEGSLKRLRMDRIDLYQYHQPDGVTPVAETLAALSELVDEGLVTALGWSNVSAPQVEEAEGAAREHGFPRFETVQNEYSLLQRTVESAVVPACEHLGISILPYYPLARGLLTGKYRRDEAGPAGSRLSTGGPAGSDRQFDVVEALEAFAAERGLRVLDVAIAGLAAQPAVGSVIAGATRPEQVAANVAALRWQPSAADLEELDRITAAARR
jgi:aryl-alcohol dehydrogenase-like predicted oxidoreductase